MAKTTIKRIVQTIALIAVASVTLSSCQYAVVPHNASKTRALSNGIIIDGCDISGMLLTNAESALTAHHAALLPQLKYDFAVTNKRITLSAQELLLKFDTAAALEYARSLPQLEDDSPREIQASIIVPDPTATRAVLAKAAQTFYVAPIGAQATYTDGTIAFTDDVEGVSADVDRLYADLENALTLKKSAFIAVKLNSIPVAQAQTLESVESSFALLGEYVTYFNRRPYNGANRVHNIVKGAGIIDGTVLEPNEIFDTNATLGRRTGEAGWAKAGAFSGGQSVIAYGGGICQISSTLYNAVLQSDLQVVERHPHSKHVGYVPKGRDATISYGGPNFRFKNNSAGRILISVIADKTTQSITARIYGMKSADYNITIITEQLSASPSANSSVAKDVAAFLGMAALRDSVLVNTYKVYCSPDGAELKRVLVSSDVYETDIAENSATD